MSTNILAFPQREKAGASTFGKYQFQYHWALCRVIAKHGKKEEYALFVEHHDDVVIASSLDVNIANFEFFQVKDQQASFTINALTKRSRGKKGLKNSVLGKLLSGASHERLRDRVSKIGLVSTSKFSNITKDDLELDIIRVCDLAEDSLKEITDKIKLEIGMDALPDTLHFIVPEIQSKTQENYVVAEIVKLIDTLFPGTYSNALLVYRAIADDLLRKIRVTADDKDWERFIETKALTSDDVNDVLKVNVDDSMTSKVGAEFDNIAARMGWRYKKEQSVKNSFLPRAISRKGFITSAEQNIIERFALYHKSIEEDDYANDKDYFSALILKAASEEGSDPDDNDLISEVFYALLRSGL